MAEQIHTEARLKGTPLSEGCAVARVCLFNESRHSNLPIFKIDPSAPDQETDRFRRALAIARDRLEAIREEVSRRIGKAEAEIFVAQRMILEDPALTGQVTALLEGKAYTAEGAISEVLDAFEEKIRALNNDYMRERASDFGEVKRRLLDVLGNMRPSLQCGDSAHCQRGRDRIIVAEELTPELTVELDTERLMGIVTERGGPQSHGAILARALGIPGVTGIPNIRRRVRCGTEVLVNGTTGEVIVWPGDETIHAEHALRPGDIRLPEPHPPVPGLKVLANIGRAADMQEARRMQAEGIGLYRTEIELIAAGRLLTADEMTGAYRQVVEAMEGRPVVFRLFDIGSDKPVRFLGLPDEHNPALGWRGMRLLLDKPELLREQVRALARLSRETDVEILYPMVTGMAQFRRARERVEQAAAPEQPGRLRHGVLFEVPAACLEAEAILDACDFASIGTNDLMQYLVAMDRTNEYVAGDFDPLNPALWELVTRIAAAGSARGKPVSVCGELAGDPDHVRRLMDAGVGCVSVSPRRIAAVRRAAAVS